MSSGIINIRGERFSLDHVLLAETHDATKNAGNIPNPERFKARIVFTDGDSKLVEQSVAQFADEYNFRHLAGPDDIAVNPAIKFRVAEFDLAAAQARNPEFKPERNFASRLSWGNGPGQSRLLVADADTAAASLLASATRVARGRSGPPIEARNE